MISPAPFVEFNDQRLARIQALSRTCAGVVSLISLLALMGWSFGIDTFKSVWPGLAPMKVSTAISLLLLGISLWLLQDPPGRSVSRQVARLCAAIAALAGLLTVVQYASGWDLGIEQLLFHETATDAPQYSGRMPLNTAIELFLLGSALLLQRRETGRESTLAATPAAVAMLVGFLALIGYAYGVSSLYRVGEFSTMAVHTAVSCLLLGLGILFANPQWGVMAVLASNSAGGAILRRLVPAAFLVPPLLGWLEQAGERLDYYDTQFGAALMATTQILIFVSLIVWSGKSIHYQERERRLAQDEIHRLFTFSQDLLCVAGFDGYFKRLNPAWEKSLGYSLDELIARPYLELVHPEDVEATRAEAARLAQGGATVAFENRYRHLRRPRSVGNFPAPERWGNLRLHGTPGGIGAAASAENKQSYHAAQILIRGDP